MPTKTRRFHFTKASVAALRPPRDRDRVYHYDLRKPSLAICVTAKGVKTFYVYRRIDGRPERVRLGAFPDMTVEQARRKADEVNGRVAQGKNPASEKRQQRGEMTVEDLWTYYRDTYCEPHGKNRDAHYRYNLHLARWGKRKVSSITPADVRKLHHEIGDERGKVTANHAVTLLRTMWNYGTKTGRLNLANPCTGFTKFAEHSRERFLTADELPRWFEAVQAEPNETLRDYFLLSLFLGQRRANMLSMAWSDVNLDARIWTVPATQAKGDKSITVYISDPALEVLKRRQASGSPFVFAGVGKHGHLAEPKKAWARLCERAEIHDLRIHDLRRTYGSWQAMSGASLQVIGKSLGHSSVAATQVYSRLKDIEPVKQSVDAATAAMLAAMNGKAADDEA